jgi:hypothetical protein
MISALFLLSMATTTPPPSPPRIVVAARARIMRGERIDFRRTDARPVGTVMRKGLIEFY